MKATGAKQIENSDPQTRKIPVIPFGKYRGKPATILDTDENYKYWLVNQHWFCEKFKSLNRFICEHLKPVRKKSKREEAFDRFVENVIREMDLKDFNLNIRLNQWLDSPEAHQAFSEGAWI